MKLRLCLILSLCADVAVGQTTSNEMLRQQMIKDWERAKAYTQEYLNAMPADKYNFRPMEGLRSFAEQMLHFSQSNTGMAVIGTGLNDVGARTFFSPNFGKSPSAQSRDSVIYYVTTSYDFMINSIRNLDLNKLAEEVSWTMPGGRRTATRLGWLLKSFEHQTHHRGQCTIYLRLAGITPPHEKLWD
jgi:uncharacterized damage-inducible protein DinB